MRKETLMVECCQVQTEELKESYICKIVELLRKCNDISLLDLIHRLLEKSI